MTLPSLKLPEWIVAITAILGLLAGTIAWVSTKTHALETTAHADSTYERRDSAAVRELEIRHILFGLDSSDRCNRRQTNYCR